MSSLVSLFVQAARFQEFRSLMVEVSRASTREFADAVLPFGWGGSSREDRRTGGGQTRRGRPALSEMDVVALTALLTRVCLLVTITMLLVLYSLAPRTLLPAGGV